MSTPDSDITFTAETFDHSWWSAETDVVVPAGAIPAGFTTVAVTVTVRAPLNESSSSKTPIGSVA
jgi:hypothetical protein